VQKLGPSGETEAAGPGATIEGHHTIRKLLELDLVLRSAFGTSLLSHDFRLILQAIASTSMIVKDASTSSLLSGRAFHQLLKRLETGGIIRFQTNPDDRRSKSIVVDEGFVDILNASLGD
jgi:DNA-binding MarR family transcriptional regulator